MNTALVTGSSRGIGAACAAALARTGYKVCINCIERMDLAEKLAAQLRSEGHKAMCHQADVAEASAVKAKANTHINNAPSLVIVFLNSRHRSWQWPCESSLISQNTSFNCFTIGGIPTAISRPPSDEFPRFGVQASLIQPSPRKVVTENAFFFTSPQKKSYPTGNQQNSGSGKSTRFSAPADDRLRLTSR